MTAVVRDPFFWAFLVGSGFYLLGSLWFSRGLRWLMERKPLLWLALALIEGRFLLVLPLCEQPRFSLGGWEWALGGALLALAAVVTPLPLLMIRPLTAPEPGMTLATTGPYAWVRNPLYLGEMLAYAGLAVGFGSALGVALTPVFWGFFLLHTLMEERELEAALGEEYRRYKARVRGRMIPGLPI